MSKIKKALSLMFCLSLLVMTFVGCGSNGSSEQTDSNNSSDSSSVASDTASGTASQADNYDSMARVNVLSYNIYYKDVNTRANNIIDLIKKRNPDVFGVQEASVDWTSYLNKAFVDSGEYAFYGFGRYGGEWGGATQQSGEQYSLIMYKTAKFDLVKSGHFWCSSTPNVFSARWTDGVVSKFPRCINWVMLKDKETGKEMVFVNNHLDPENENVRIYSAQLITDKMKEIADGRLCVLVGDWNSGLTKPSYAKIVSNGFKDVRSIAAETTKIGTFNDWGKRDKESWAFGDIIFANEGSEKVKKFDVLADTYDGEYISDHCPVIAEIYY